MSVHLRLETTTTAVAAEVSWVYDDHLVYVRLYEYIDTIYIPGLLLAYMQYAFHQLNHNHDSNICYHKLIWYLAQANVWPPYKKNLEYKFTSHLGGNDKNDKMISLYISISFCCMLSLPVCHVPCRLHLFIFFILLNCAV